MPIFMKKIEKKIPSASRKARAIKKIHDLTKKSQKNRLRYGESNPELVGESDRC